MELSLQPGNLYLIIEFLFAELIFLYPVPKRDSFWCRLICSAVISIAISSFIPWLSIQGLVFIPYVLRSLLIFAFSVAAMGFSFRLPPHALFSMCVAGYAVQHIAYRISWLICQTSLFAETPLSVLGRDRVLEILTVLIVYGIMLATFGRFSAKNECFKNSNKRLDAVSVLVILICVFLTRLPRLVGEDGLNITGSIYSILCCLLALFIQFNLHQMELLENERNIMERLHREEKKQYEISKNTIDSINIKVHDAKHKLAAYHGKLLPEEVASLQQDINIYDSVVKMGSEALDVLLTEKSNKCRRLGIQLTCSGDGGALSFMKTMDIYSLFGNAVDNAIEAVEPLEKDKRLIDLSIERRGDLVFLSFSNYFSGSLDILDGVPRTTKTQEPGYHGYGMKSMKLIASKYGGELSITTREEIFILNIYFQIPRP